jgi:hypothetical protein
MRDLADLGGGPSRLSVRRFLTLLTRLPPDGAFAAELAAVAWREKRDGVKRDATDQPEWLTWFGRSPLWYILADLYDLTAAVNSDPKKKRPDPYPRTPGGVKSGVPFADALRMF